jgi:hypothetical protein
MGGRPPNAPKIFFFMALHEKVGGLDLITIFCGSSVFIEVDIHYFIV